MLEGNKYYEGKWTQEEIDFLMFQVREQMPLQAIAHFLDRSYHSVLAKKYRIEQREKQKVH